MMLLEWMQEFSDEFLFKRQTYYLAIYYVDLYLTKQKNIPLKDFQLLGATALFMASKFEEINPPRVKDIVFATDNGYN